ncbi:MAG: TonB-dependent receptor [Bacteroidota bacterium]
MKRIYLLWACLLQLTVSIGQNVSGVILDASKDRIAGAYVVLSSTEIHTHSDDFGKFMLEGIQQGDTLKIIHLGYEPQAVVVNDVNERLVVELKESSFQLSELVVNQNSKEVNVISTIDIELNPVRSAQEFLRKVPGLFIGQHAGGGKAEQIFLRGFDIDHGTDVNIVVDGMPVNMVSHAHGQGYADMHFVIPETVEKLDFGKGPYYANKGNFTTAGYVEFTTKKKLDQSQISFEAGRFNTFRTVGLFNLLDTEKQNAYIATEYMISDGPFEASQHFIRSNFMGKYTTQLNRGGELSILASHFTSTWDASGQIPQRAVDQGLITRFGAIDDTEGGETSRTNIALTFDRILTDRAFIKNRVYYSLYDFELFSNFTFFLEDPINGDQIRQTEDRQIFGGESVFNYSMPSRNVNSLFQLGIGFRNDEIIGNELARTKNRRTTLESIQLGDVDEKNLYTFAKAEFDVNKWLFEAAVRFDFFEFNYVNNLDTVYENQSQSKGIVSPKFNIIYNLNNSIQLFLKSGIGFHSNDARVVLEQDNSDILPAAYGVDVGSVFKPTKRMFANVALWYLYLEQEFVYVGDAGIVEPSGETRRLGVDVGLRYQVNDWIFANADFNYAFARSLSDPEGEDLIPLAPIVTATGGLNFDRDRFHGSLQFRYLQDRPANEDDSIEAIGYTITDLNLSYDVGNASFGVAIENLFDQEWNETQFATESRLRNESAPVEEIHFTPGTPFFIKGIFRYKF